MKGRDLRDMLEKVFTCHPEALEAEVWSGSANGKANIHVKYVGFDKKHKPARIKLEE